MQVLQFGCESFLKEPLCSFTLQRHFVDYITIQFAIEQWKTAEHCWFQGLDIFQ